MTRALVTGVTGCVGSNLAAALIDKGARVVGLSLKCASTLAIDGLDLELVCGDILDPECLTQVMEGVDWVFHVAGIADDWRHKSETVYQTNVEGTRNVLAAAQAAGVKRFVLTASAAMLGVPTKEKPVMDETSPFNFEPKTWPYAHSKLLAEQAMLEYVVQGMHAVSILPTAILGPGDINFICGQLIQRALKRDLFPFPDGGANFIDVRDVADAEIAAAEHGRDGERYLIGGLNMSHLYCTGTIADALTVPIHYIRVPRGALPAVGGMIDLLAKAGFPMPMDGGRVVLSGRYMYYDNQKAVRELGLKVRPFTETVRDTFLWYLDHGLLEGYTIPESFSARMQQGESPR
jgi:dihydroflavonol-4-reductase